MMRHTSRCISANRYPVIFAVTPFARNAAISIGPTELPCPRLLGQHAQIATSSTDVLCPLQNAGNHHRGDFLPHDMAGILIR
jgi:hypothetical protein